MTLDDPRHDKTGDRFKSPTKRFEDNLDVSYRDVPYPVVPSFTGLPIVHEAVECEGVVWHMGSSERILARLKCGKRGVEVDRNNESWSRPCKRCYPEGDAS